MIGSGFIGCEAAASLAMRGLARDARLRRGHPARARLGEEAGRRITGWLEELGVTLPARRRGDRRARREPTRPPTLILMAAGVQAARGARGDAGLDVETGGSWSTSSMRTRADGVYAAGDVAFAHNAAAGRQLAVEHWGEALNMGEVAGRTIAGEDAQWDVAPGFWSTIGEHTLKYVAWGDGFDETRVVDHGGGAWTVWYGARTASPSACSPTSATRTTSAAASWSSRGAAAVRGLRRRPRARRGGADRRVHRRARRPDRRRPRRLRGPARARPLHRRDRGSAPARPRAT